MRMRNVTGLVLAGLLAGCAGSGAARGHERVGALADRMDDVGEALDRARAEIQIAMEEHSALVAGGDGKLVVHYTSLVDALDEIEEARDELDGEIADLLEDGADYLERWESDLDAIESGSLREQSAARLKQTRDRYQAMRQAAEMVGGSWAPVMTTLRDHVAYLRHDLTPGAVQSLSGEAVALRRAVSALGAAMEDFERRAADFRTRIAGG